jgi:hypothetical protein
MTHVSFDLVRRMYTRESRDLQRILHAMVVYTVSQSVLLLERVLTGFTC